jgi:hypothetical protein
MNRKEPRSGALHMRILLLLVKQNSMEYKPGEARAHHPPQ